MSINLSAREGVKALINRQTFPFTKQNQNQSFTYTPHHFTHSQLYSFIQLLPQFHSLPLPTPTKAVERALDRCTEIPPA